MSINRDHHREIGFMISWLINKVHISTPYDEVADDIAERCERANSPEAEGPGITARQRARWITDALIQHRRNQADYAWVMGSH